MTDRVCKSLDVGLLDIGDVSQKSPEHVSEKVPLQRRVERTQSTGRCFDGCGCLLKVDERQEALHLLLDIRHVPGHEAGGTGQRSARGVVLAFEDRKDIQSHPVARVTPVDIAAIGSICHVRSLERMDDVDSGNRQEGTHNRSHPLTHTCYPNETTAAQKVHEKRLGLIVEGMSQKQSIEVERFRDIAQSEMTQLPRRRLP